jgi:oligopeptide transport system substrate-binding protein
VYDDLILYKAPKAPSREARYALFTEAETMLMEQMPIIPLYTYTSKHLVHPSVEGMHTNLMDSLNLKYITLVQGRTLPEALR